MEQAVIDGKVSYSRSGATSKNVNWISLITPKDAKLIQEYLKEFKDTERVPDALQEFEMNSGYFDSRYDASIKWIQDKNHAVISNGPFSLKSYSPESRTITVSSFDDKTYPFTLGYWSEFENPEFPKISNVKIPNIVNKSSEFIVNVETLNADSLLYFLANSKGNIISSELIKIDSVETEIVFSKDIMKNLDIGANNLKIFAISEKVLKPDYYSSSFLVTENYEELPEINYDEIKFDQYTIKDITWILVPATILIAILFIIMKKIQDKP
jgi:peptide/nickel transport system substrate-binding protein